MIVTKGELIKRINSFEKKSFNVEEKRYCNGEHEIIIKIYSKIEIEEKYPIKHPLSESDILIRPKQGLVTKIF